MGLRSGHSFVAGFGLCLLMVACAGAQFPYHYLPYDKSHGKLLGPTEADDLPDSVCDTKVGQAYPCIVTMTDEFYKLKADYLKLQTDLIACQQGAVPKP